MLRYSMVRYGKAGSPSEYGHPQPDERPPLGQPLQGDDVKPGRGVDKEKEGHVSGRTSSWLPRQAAPVSVGARPRWWGGRPGGWSRP